MAYQAGPLRFKGKLGGLSFYHNKQYGYLVRQKGGPSKDQVVNSDHFVRTRENASEFSLAATAGKLIRQAVMASTGFSGDAGVSQRLTGVLVRLGKTDHYGVRGMRSPARVFEEPESGVILRSFAFYGSQAIASVYKGQIQCDFNTGKITLSSSPGMMSAQADCLFRKPKGSTHVRIKAAIAVLDFDRKRYIVFPALPYIAAMEEVMPAVDFECGVSEEGILPKIGVVAIEFLQEKNGELYVLKDEVSLGIV